MRAPIHAAIIDGLVAADLVLTFDRTVLVPLGASTGVLTPRGNLVANVATPGQVSLSMASGGGAVTGGGVLACVDFDVIGAPTSTTALTLASAHLNGGAIPVSTAAGSVEVEAVSSLSGAVTL